MRCELGCDQEACLALRAPDEPPAFVCRAHEQDFPPSQVNMLDGEAYVHQGGCLGCWNDIRHVH